MLALQQPEFCCFLEMKRHRWSPTVHQRGASEQSRERDFFHHDFDFTVGGFKLGHQLEPAEPQAMNIVTGLAFVGGTRLVGNRRAENLQTFLECLPIQKRQKKTKKAGEEEEEHDPRYGDNPAEMEELLENHGWLFVNEQQQAGNGNVGVQRGGAGNAARPPRAARPITDEEVNELFLELTNEMSEAALGEPEELLEDAYIVRVVNVASSSREFGGKAFKARPNAAWNSAAFSAFFGIPETSTFYISAHGAVEAALLCREWARRMAYAFSFWLNTENAVTWSELCEHLSFNYEPLADFTELSLGQHNSAQTEKRIADIERLFDADEGPLTSGSRRARASAVGAASVADVSRPAAKRRVR